MQLYGYGLIICCFRICALATMALNLFVNFLRFVVIFPNVFYPLQNYSFFTLTHALNSGVHYTPEIFVQHFLIVFQLRFQTYFGEVFQRETTENHIVVAAE